MSDIRKDKRLDNILISDYQGDTLLSNVYLEHNSFPEMNFKDIDTKVTWYGKDMSFPLIINAITGGTEQSIEINEILYTLAKELNISMGVGNQDLLLKNPESIEFYLDDSKEKRDIVMLSNLHAQSDQEAASYAMAAVNADAICLHVNIAQEIVGGVEDRDFSNLLSNLKMHASQLGERLIVKEIGSGMSEKTVSSLIEQGVSVIDVSGAGGTNIIELENLQNHNRDYSELYEWGIPTAKSLINARRVSKDITLIASGGIRTAMDIVKSIVLGADFVGVGGELLKYVLHGGHDYAKEYLEKLMYNTKVIMYFLGARNVEELKRVPYKLTGRLREITECIDSQ